MIDSQKVTMTAAAVILGSRELFNNQKGDANDAKSGQEFPPLRRQRFESAEKNPIEILRPHSLKQLNKPANGS